MDKKRKIDKITLLVFCLYIGGLVSIFLWAYRYLPSGVMNHFVALWTAAMFTIPIGYVIRYPMILRIGVYSLWIPCALFVQFAMLHYHLSAIGAVFFTVVWLIGWQYQEKHSPWTQRLIGTLIGGLLLIGALLVMGGQIYELRDIWPFKHLDPRSVHYIELRRESDKMFRRIHDRAIIIRIVTAFQASYPYVGRGATFGKDPWEVRIFFRTLPRVPLSFRIGKGIPINAKTIWLTFEEDSRDHDYQNADLYMILTQELTPGIW